VLVALPKLWGIDGILSTRTRSDEILRRRNSLATEFQTTVFPTIVSERSASLPGAVRVLQRSVPSGSWFVCEAIKKFCLRLVANRLRTLGQLAILTPPQPRGTPTNPSRNTAQLNAERRPTFLRRFRCEENVAIGRRRRLLAELDARRPRSRSRS